MSHYAAAFAGGTSEEASKVDAPFSKMKGKLLGFINKIPDYCSDVDPGTLRRPPPPY